MSAWVIMNGDLQTKPNNLSHPALNAKLNCPPSFYIVLFFVRLKSNLVLLGQLRTTIYFSPNWADKAGDMTGSLWHVLKPITIETKEGVGECFLFVVSHNVKIVSSHYSRELIAKKVKNNHMPPMGSELVASVFCLQRSCQLSYGGGYPICYFCWYLCCA